MAVELADRLAELTPGDCNRIFFTTGGSEAVESAWKLARQYFRVTGQPDRLKVISRNIAYHGATMGALSITGLSGIKTPFEPLVPGAIKVPNTNFYRAPYFADDLEAFGQWAADAIEQAILIEGPDTVAAVFLEPVQNAGGLLPAAARLLPAGAGDLRPLRRAAGVRRGHLRLRPARPLVRGRALRLPARHRHHGQGPDQRLLPTGGHGGQRPAGRAVPPRGELPPRRHLRRSPGERGGGPGQHRRLREGEPARERAARTRRPSRRRSTRSRDLPIVGDVRGAGYFYGIELVKDKDTRETFDDDESERLLRGFLSGALYDAGLICRADDRGDPVVQLAPPLTCGEEEFEVMTSILRSVLTEAWKQI